MNAADLGCREPVYNAFGEVWAWRTTGQHDWRLFSREQEHRAEYVQQENAPGYGTVTLTPTSWIEVWYCSRCRITDRRIVEEDQ